MALLCLCCFLTVHAAAQKRITLKPLNIGETLPESFWSTKHSTLTNGEVTQTELRTFKGKPLILDFWATWCGVCIAHMPQLIALQEQFAPKMQVLLVNCTNTRDTEETVKNFFKSRPELLKESSALPVLSDTTFNTLFPHRFLPHYVWIDGKGKVAAFTSAEFISAKQVEQFVKGRDVE